jgi:hypothetical protein
MSKVKKVERKNKRKVREKYLYYVESKKCRKEKEVRENYLYYIVRKKSRKEKQKKGERKIPILCRK